MLQYGLQTMMEFPEDCADAGELEKLEDSHKLPNIVSAPETEKQDEKEDWGRKL